MGIPHDQHTPCIPHKREAPGDQAWLVRKIFHVDIFLIVTYY